MTTNKRPKRWKDILARTRAARTEIATFISDAPAAAVPPPTLRAYEARAVLELRAKLRTAGRVIAVGPTGCGKTVVASALIQAETAWKTLFIVHRYELADQAHRSLASTGVEAGVIMAQEEAIHGSWRVDASARVQVASVQTLVRRRLPEQVDLIVVDEAHRVLADSYQKIVAWHPKALVLGLTATPERADGQGLGNFFRDLYIIARSSDLQSAKYLATPRWFGARADVVAELTERLRGAHGSQGDYAPKDLARAVDSRFLLGNVVSESLRIAPGVSKVVFAGSVLHSQQLAEAFAQAGVSAAHLDGHTPARERETLLARLAAGNIEVLCNYDVLGEGWDLPNLGAVVLARPFRSRTKYLQVVGRGMRGRPGPQPIVIDHGNNAPRFGLWPGDDVAWMLVGTPPRTEAGLWKQCEACLEKIPLAATRCPVCGHECPIERGKREREETEAKLEEATRAQYLALRARVTEEAAKKGAPPGWIEKIMGEFRR